MTPLSSPRLTDAEDIATSLHITTIFATNIHCPSCVSHIEDVVRQSVPGRYVHSIDVSVVAGEIILRHEAAMTVRDVCHDISNAAFEVRGATTVDAHERVVSELRFSHTSDGHGFLEDAAERLRSSLPPLSPANWSRTKRKRHNEICLACQEKEKCDDKASVFSDASEAAPPFACNEKQGFTCNDKEETDCDEEKYGAVAVVKTVASSRRSSTATARDLPDTENTDNSNYFGSAVEASSPSVLTHTPVPGAATLRCELSIGGMTCSACTNAVHDGLSQLEQVRDVTVNLLTNSAVVLLDGTGSDVDQLVEAVEDMGFDAAIFKVEQLSAGARKGSAFSTLVDADEHAQRRGSADTVVAKLSVGGMTCSACTNGVTDCLTSLPYVRKASVSLMTHSAEVEFEGADNLDSIVSAVEDMGHDCTVDGTQHVRDDSSDASRSNSVAEAAAAATTRQVQVMVQGFFCEHCPGRVADSLRSKSSSISIDRMPDLKHPVISLSYTPDAKASLTIRDVIKAVEDSDPHNFRASIYHPPSIEERSRQVQAQERRRLLLRLVISTIIVLPTFVIGVVLMDLLPAGNSARRYIMQPTWCGVVPRAQWALFILATPVYFFAADVFHRRAVKEIRALWGPRSRVPVVKRLTKFGSMNLLVSTGTTVAYVSSVALLIADAATPVTTTMGQGAAAPKSSSTYFDTVVFLTFFILIGRFLEAYSKSKAGDAIALLGDRRPSDAILVSTAGEQTRISADLLEVGDVILVPHGQSPAADGVLVDTATTTTTALFDESSLTGESRSVSKAAGDEVFTGTINVGPPVSVLVRKTGGASMLDQIINVVREGQTKRAPVEAMADVITGYFVPVITLLAMLTFAVWVSLGYGGALDARYLAGQSGGWAFWSLEFAIAVFVVACPCGIGLAAPTALFVGGGLAAKHGILARGGGHAFQNAGALDAVVFDKTGTLTEGGDLSVTNVETSPDHAASEPWLLTLARDLEAVSAHPIAVAVAADATQRLAAAPHASSTPQITSRDITEVPGHGMRGVFTTSSGVWRAAIGSPRFARSLLAARQLPAHMQACVDRWERESKTTVVLTVLAPDAAADSSSSSSSWRAAAVFAIEDAIRASAAPAVAALQRRGLAVYMLTGDNEATAQAVAARVGIPAPNVFAAVLPTEKADKVRWLQDNLRRPAADVESQGGLRETPRRRWWRRAPIPRTANVAFVGDGINDAPALARADISISPASGAPVAANASSFILVAPTLMAIPTLLDISTRVFNRVRLNFAWALVYNVVLVPVAAGVFFRASESGFRLGPVWGSLAMALSSVSVVVSSLLLRWETWPWQRSGART